MVPDVPAAVVFDCDGTLADSYDAITASVNHVRAANNLPAVTRDEVRKHVGRGLEKLLAGLLPGTDLDRNAALYRAHHGSVIAAHTRLLPGAREALEALKRTGRLLAVCSNKNVAFTRLLLDSLGIAEFFAVVLGPDDVPHPKPCPTCRWRRCVAWGSDWTRPLHRRHGRGHPDRAGRRCSGLGGANRLGRPCDPGSGPAGSPSRRASESWQWRCSRLRLRTLRSRKRLDTAPHSPIR